MEMRSGIGAALTALAVFAVAAADAGAGTLVFEHRFTSQRPGAAADMTSRIVYPDYQGKPKAVARLVVELPAGARFDESVVPVCAASDAELAARGTGACPRTTWIGGGTATVVTGFGPPIDPIGGDVLLVHGPGQIVNLGTPPGSDRVLVTSRGFIQGTRIVYDEATGSTMSAPGGPPDGRTTGRDVSLSLSARTLGERSFLTTPTICPASRAWTFALAATYQDGTTDTATSPSPCQPASSPPRRRAAPAMRLLVSPRRVRAGRATRFRLRLVSSSPRCVRGAAVRFAGVVRRTDRRGRATLVARLRRPGPHRARAARPGCRTATATVAVV